MKRVPTVCCCRNDTGDLLLVPTAYNEFGWGVMVNRVRRLPSDASDAEVGLSLIHSFSFCDIAYYDPAHGAPELAAAGLKKQREFNRAWQSVIVKREELWSFIPTARSKKEYRDLTSQALSLPPQTTPDKIGATLRATFQRCIEAK